MKFRIRLILNLLIVMMLLSCCGKNSTANESDLTSSNNKEESNVFTPTITKEEHIHNWEAATCESGKKCSTCGEIEGEALGHTVKLGECSRCKKIQGQSSIKEVENHVKNAMSYYNSYIEYAKMTSNATTMEEIYNAVYAEYEFALNACAEIEFAYKIIEKYGDEVSTKVSNMKKDMQIVIAKSIIEPKDDTESLYDSIVSIGEVFADVIIISGYFE